MSARLSRTLLALILVIYLLLALGYGIVTPLFEAPDEHLHYFTADFIAREGRLPTTRDPGLMAQESAQPPLYYVLGALIARATGGASDLPQLWPNPRSNPADPYGESLARPPLNANVFIHGPAEAWPWRGYVLSAHLIRMLSTLLGLGTLLCIYGAGRTVWPGNPERSLSAVALVAFLPQFAFVHGAVSNDAAITFFSAASIWQLLRITNYDSCRPTNLRITNGKRDAIRGSSFISYALLGITVGLAMLSKTAGLLLLAWCVAVLVAWEGAGDGGHRLRRASRSVAAVALPALAIGGWWLWRNWLLYGDPTAANQFVRLAGGLRPYTLYQVWLDMDRVWTSLFARFGWMNVRPPAWVWIVWSAIAIIAAVGGIRGLMTTRWKRPLTIRSLFHPALILLGWFLLVAAAWLQFMLRTPADQGRLFFPALTTLALGAAYGLSRWPRPWTHLLVVGLALLTSAYSLAVVIPRAYAAAPIIAALPADATPLDITFPEGLELIGARVETTEARPGDWVWATLYWRARAERSPGAPLVFLELFGRGFHRIGLQVGYHGRGNFPSTLWPVGEIVADRMAVRVADDAETPVMAKLTVKLDGDEKGIDIGAVKVTPGEWPARAEPIAVIGDGIELAAAALSTQTAAPGETVEVRLRWQVTAPPGPALLHLFAHLGDPSAAPPAQTDGPVMGGEYPSSLWAVGEAFDETISLSLPDDLPPGEYPITIGLYDFVTGARLPLVVEGQRLPTDAIIVGRLIVR